MPDDTQIHETTIYFAYGSNMCFDQMKRRCPNRKYIEAGLLSEWCWIINQRGVANVVTSAEDYVHGIAYEINSVDEKSLDDYEGVPHSYEKKILPLELSTCSSDGEAEKRTTNALVYADPRTSPGLPQTGYIRRMNKAIKDALQKGIPQSYVDKYIRPFVPEQETSQD